MTQKPHTPVAGPESASLRDEHVPDRPLRAQERATQATAGTEAQLGADAVDGDMHEVAGRIKWFDSARGFGFIAQDSGPDVMLHAAALRREGRSAIREGARVVCIAAMGARGLYAVRLLAVDETHAVHPSEMTPRTRLSVTPESGLELATVKWFNRLRGYGFVNCAAGGPDIFVHMDLVRRCGLAAPRPGQVVAVRYGAGARGLMATEIHDADDGQGPPPDLRH